MLQIYNSLSKKQEDFKPITDGKISMYSCGPTVYGLPHIGNYRAFLFNDILKRSLTFLSYEVFHVMNITDVDDKTIRDSQKSGKTLREFTQFYTNEFNRELELLNILPVDKQVLATDHIDEMVQMIETLKEKGFAYTGEDGSTYFSISKFADYGALSGISLENKQHTLSRIIADEYDKENPQDFALWKAWTPEDGENFWDPSTTLGTSPSLGKGRPGWHIECSAMATKYLGNHFDIHTGGVDLAFPHHENEIAQSVCSTGEKFVNYFLHNEHILIDGQKMAKSKGNQFNLSDIVEKGYSPLDFRYFVLGAHYRTKINLTWESLDASRNARMRLMRLLEEIDEIGKINIDYSDKFKAALEDDINTSKALALVWELIKDESVSRSDVKATLLDWDKVLGLSLEKAESQNIPDEILEIITKRDIARSERNFEQSDILRAELEAFGYEVLDTKDGTKIINRKEI